MSTMRSSRQNIKVSVIIPSFNRACYLVDAIESVINQTFHDFELIVVDDGSTDNTRGVCERYKDWLIYVRHNEKRGQSAARNTGIMKARGEFIAFLDSDDMFMPDKLEKQFKMFAKRPGLDCCYTQCYFCDENGRIYDTFLKNHRCPDDALQYFISVIFPATSSSIMVRKKCFFDVGFYDENLETCEDYDLAIRLASKCCFFYIDESLVKIRHHSSNMSRSGSSLLKHQVMIKVWEKNDHILNKLHYKHKWWLAKEYYNLGRQYFFMDKVETGRKFFLKASKIAPERLYYLFYYLTMLPTRLVNVLKILNRLYRMNICQEKKHSLDLSDLWWNKRQ